MSLNPRRVLSRLRSRIALTTSELPLMLGLLFTFGYVLHFRVRSLSQGLGRPTATPSASFMRVVLSLMA